MLLLITQGMRIYELILWSAAGDDQMTLDRLSG